MTPDTLLQRHIPWRRLLLPVGISLVTLIGLGFAVDGETNSRPSLFVGPTFGILLRNKTKLKFSFEDFVEAFWDANSE